MRMELPIVKEPSIWQGFQAFIPCWCRNKGLNKSVLHIESPRFLAQGGASIRRTTVCVPATTIRCTEASPSSTGCQQRMQTL